MATQYLGINKYIALPTTLCRVPLIEAIVQAGTRTELINASLNYGGTDQSGYRRVHDILNLKTTWTLAIVMDYLLTPVGMHEKLMSIPHLPLSTKAAKVMAEEYREVREPKLSNAKVESLAKELYELAVLYKEGYTRPESKLIQNVVGGSLWTTHNCSPRWTKETFTKPSHDFLKDAPKLKPNGDFTTHMWRADVINKNVTEWLGKRGNGNGSVGTTRKVGTDLRIGLKAKVTGQIHARHLNTVLCLVGSLAFASAGVS